VNVKMLASDSDSDFEYPEGGDSGASSDNEYGLLGKLALGVDPQDLKAYDGRSTPQNGSQYLMKVMSEKKKCNFNESKGDQDGINASLLPSTKWRDETVSNFSLVRSRIERWRHKIESGEKWLDNSVTLPDSNDNLTWLRFCFGQPFVKVELPQKRSRKNRN